MVRLIQFPFVGCRSNREHRPSSSPTPAEAEMNANNPLRQSEIGKPTQKASHASVVATATSEIPRPAAQAPAEDRDRPAGPGLDVRLADGNVHAAADDLRI